MAGQQLQGFGGLDLPPRIAPQDGGAALRRDDAVHGELVHQDAVAHRDAEYIYVIQASWVGDEGTAANVAWARDYFEAVQPYSSGGTYVNFLNQDDPQERESVRHEGRRPEEGLAAADRDAERDDAWTDGREPPQPPWSRRLGQFCGLPGVETRPRLEWSR